MVFSISLLKSLTRKMLASGINETGGPDNGHVSLSEKNKKAPWFVYIVTAVAVISGFLFGYDTGVISGAIVVLQEQYPDVIDNAWREVIVAVTLASAGCFALIGGPMSDRLGRRWTTIVSSILFIIGAILLAATPGNAVREVLVIGRIIVGAGIGLSSATVPYYIAEITPAHLRGPMVTYFQLSITIGLLTAGIFNALLTHISKDSAWRLEFVISFVPAAFQLIFFMYMPESPRWLVVNNHVDEATDVLLKICPSEITAESELRSIVRNHEQTQRRIQEQGGGPVILLMLRSAAMRRALTVGCMMQLFQQLCGINTIMYYGSSIFIKAGMSNPKKAIWFTCITSSVNFVCTFPAFYIIEKYGRRKLLFGSMMGVIFCLVILSGGFFLIREETPACDYELNNNWTEEIDAYVTRFNRTINQDYKSCIASDISTCDDCSYLTDCGFCYLKHDGHVINGTGACLPRFNLKTNDTSFSSTFSAIGLCSPDISYSFKDITLNTPKNNSEAVFATGWCPNNVEWLIILGMVLYLCSFSIGYGPVVWTVNAEIYPHWARSTGNAMATAVNWFSNFGISYTFLALAERTKRQGAFLLYAAITIVGLLIFYSIIPETRHKSLEQLEHIFDRPLATNRGRTSWSCRNNATTISVSKGEGSSAAVNHM